MSAVAPFVGSALCEILQTNAHMQIAYGLQPCAAYALPFSQCPLALQIVMCIAAPNTYRAVTTFESR